MKPHELYTRGLNCEQENEMHVSQWFLGLVWFLAHCMQPSRDQVKQICTTKNDGFR